MVDQQRVNKMNDDTIDIQDTIPESDTNNQGFTLLTRGEIVNISGIPFRVLSFTKKRVTCQKLSESLGTITKGQKVKIREGNFVIDSFGKEFMMLRTLAGTCVWDQDIVDQNHRNTINELRKSM